MPIALWRVNTHAKAADASSASQPASDTYFSARM
jgi:hypothetical protein